MSDNKRGLDDFELKIDKDLLDQTFSDIDINDTLSANTDIRAEKVVDPRESKKSDYYRDENRKKYKKDHRKRDRIKSIKNKRVFNVVWLAMVILVSLSLGGYLITGSNDLFAVGRHVGTTEINIPENVTTEELSEILYENRVINAPEFFTLYVNMTTDVNYVTPGEHQVETTLDYEELINTLQAERPHEIVEGVLFREGLTVMEIATILDEYDICDSEEFLEAAESDLYTSYDMIGQIDNPEEKYYQVEGYLFPATYDFYIDEDVDSVIGKMLNGFQTNFTSELLDQVNQSGYTLDEIITMASIIQAEAADGVDMYRVSAVIHNRLDNGASVGINGLEMDSTIFYPYNTRDDAPEGFDSSYDTYDIEGLPPGAVVNPGISAIDAALNPDEDYLNMFYFCHSEDKTAYYAETIEQHNENLITAGLVD